MKKIIPLFMIMILSQIVIADLSEFPDSFTKAGKFNGYIVVGKKASSLDVISQSNIGLEIASLLGSPQFGINKLDDEASLDFNLILIGNPCVNEITAELLDNPDPCDKDFNQPKILFLEEDGIQYIVIAGKNDQATKEASDYFVESMTKLSGKEVVLESDDAATIEEEPEEDSEEVAEEPVPVLYEDDLPEEDETEKEMPKKQIILVDERNIFQKAWDWFASLFRK